MFWILQVTLWLAKAYLMLCYYVCHLIRLRPVLVLKPSIMYYEYQIGTCMHVIGLIYMAVLFLGTIKRAHCARLRLIIEFEVCTRSKCNLNESQ